MISNILLCSDGSDQALHAARLVAQPAKSCHAKLTLLNVFDPPFALAPYAASYERSIDAESLIRWASEAQMEVEKRAEAVFEEEGVPYATLRELGHPVDIICSAAQRLHTDLIVLGSRGLSAWQALLLGSVSEGVLHHAHCPVLVMRGEKPTIQKILLATDSSESAEKATRTAGELTQKLHADLTVLNVFEPLRSHPGLVSEDVEPEDLAARTLNVIARRTGHILDEYGIAHTLIQQEGRPTETIVRAASVCHTDLIVVGNRGLGTFKSLLLGSVSAGVARHAPCSLLVAR